MRLALSVTVIGLLLAACSGAEDLRGIDLPPASLPDEIDSEHWAVAFAHEFGSGSWAEGPHVYRLVLDCPGVVDEPLQTNISLFAARSDVPTRDGPVYLRASGLATTPLGPTGVQFISTEQDTVALLTVIGLSMERAHSATDCEAEVEFDDGRAEAMRPDEPFRP